jgi:hypothetical protein
MQIGDPVGWQEAERETKALQALAISPQCVSKRTKADHEQIWVLGPELPITIHERDYGGVVSGGFSALLGVNATVRAR